MATTPEGSGDGGNHRLREKGGSRSRSTVETTIVTMVDGTAIGTVVVGWKMGGKGGGWALITEEDTASPAANGQR